MNYFVTAIGTDSGKTLVSAILTKALQADYWKPVQSGAEEKDSTVVKRLIENNYSVFYEEAYLFKEPLSPHAAAALEGVKIDLAKIKLPSGDYENLIIEGAGGLMVPLNEKDFVIDMISKLEAQVILVSNHYLGSINHTLLTVNELKRRNIPVKGIIFNGITNEASENIILKFSGYKCLLRIQQEKAIDSEVVTRYAIKLFENWYE
jgi:dethiobiotin synthetase